MVRPARTIVPMVRPVPNDGIDGQACPERWYRWSGLSRTMVSMVRPVLNDGIDGQASPKRYHRWSGLSQTIPSMVRPLPNDTIDGQASPKRYHSDANSIISLIPTTMYRWLIPSLDFCPTYKKKSSYRGTSCTARFSLYGPDKLPGPQYMFTTHVPLA